MTLNRKQKMFVEEYLRDFSAAGAARRSGYSLRSAYNQGPRMMKHPEISTEIERLIEERTMSAREVLIRLTDIGRSDIREMLDIDERGKFEINLHKALEQKMTHLVRKVKQTERVQKTGEQKDTLEIVQEMELYSALEALELLGKYHKLFAEQRDVTLHGDKILIWDIPEAQSKSE